MRFEREAGCSVSFASVDHPRTQTQEGNVTTTELPTTAAARAVDAVKTYGQGDAAINALAGVTVAFPAHEFTAIMGPSGSGKSTLMQCVAGLDRLTSGQVFVGDTELSGLNKTELTLLRRDRLGFIFQQYNLIPTLTARENIILPLTLAGLDPDEEWFDTIVETVGMKARLQNRPSQLSGGQQQRVAVARALVPRPDIVFADEPTGALDSRTGTEILEFMRRAVDNSGQTIVMVTHDPHAASYANKVLFLADGQIIDEMAQPTTERVLDRMKRFEA
jgi:putative ABC transport system ATP-binding protein